MVVAGKKGLRRGQVIPDFTLADIHGETVSSRNYYMRRNYIVALLPDHPDDQLNEWLTVLSAAVQSINDEDAICLLIFPTTWEDGIDDLYSNGDQVKLLIDRDGDVGRSFGRDPSQTMLIIADRYGVIFHVASGNASSAELDPSAVPGWVEFVACRCS